MIQADQFIDRALDKGFDFYTGVPCSFLTPFINRASEHPRLTYVAAANEGDAVAIAAGAALAGRKTVTIFQNSGLGNAVNPLTSLNYSFQIPGLLITTWRGEPGVSDEPQHELMGEITGELLESMRVPATVFPDEVAAIDGCIEKAMASMEEAKRPYALIMRKGSVDKQPSPKNNPFRAHEQKSVEDLRHQEASLPTRQALLECFLEYAPDSYGVIATTGKCGRELFTLADRDQHLYQVGSMGCASSLALGVSMSSQHPMFVLDGDGALLMRMGALATIGAYQPKKFVHIALDNGVHDSTGAQFTVSPSVDFAAVAAACGYAKIFSCDSSAGFSEALRQSLDCEGPVFIHARMAAGSMANLGRPTVKPPEVALRFSQYLRGTA